MKFILKNIAAVLLGLSAIILFVLFMVFVFFTAWFCKFMAWVVLLGMSWCFGSFLISAWKDWRKKCSAAYSIRLINRARWYHRSANAISR